MRKAVKLISESGLERMRKKLAIKEVKAKKREYMREYYQKPEVKAKMREYMREYRQNRDAAKRALLPYQLSLEFCLACERDLA